MKKFSRLILSAALTLLCVFSLPACGGLIQIPLNPNNPPDTIPTLRELTQIEIAAPPARTEYTAGEAFNPAGMAVYAVYANGEKLTVSYGGANGYTVSPAGALSSAVTHITVSYSEGGITKTAAQAISVVEIAGFLTVKSIAVKTQPAKLAYIVGEVFDPAGMAVEVVWSDDSKTIITSGWTLSPFASLTKAHEASGITVSYGGQTAKVTITVKEITAIKQVVGIELSAPEGAIAIKKLYNVGESFDRSSVVVTAKYDDGTSAEIWDYTVFPAGPYERNPGFTVTITYAAKTATIEDVVVKALLQSVEVDWPFVSFAPGIRTTYDLTTKLTPAVADDIVGTGVWAIEVGGDANVVTVNNGVITAGSAAGTATVTYTVTTETGSKTAECKVTNNLSPTVISTPAQLAAALNTGNRAGWYQLTGNIDVGAINLPAMPQAEWYPLERPLGVEGGWYIDHGNFFNGIFDGRGYQLMNVIPFVPAAADGAIWGTSIFGVIGKSGIVQRVAVSGYNVSGVAGQVSVFAQHNHGKIINCRLSNIQITSTGNGQTDPTCFNAVIAAFNYNLVENCVIAGASYGAQLSAFAVRNRTNLLTHGDFKNCFAIYTGAAAPARNGTGFYELHSMFWTNADVKDPQYTGCFLFQSDSAAAVDMSNYAALSDAIWNKTAGSIPTLKTPV